MKLHLADGLALPLEVVTEKLAFLGRTGTGKTYAAMKLAELMLEAGAQIVAVDAVGKWYGLRVDGAGPGFPIPVFGGLNGDFPLEATGGRILADVIVDRGISAVLDVSQFTHGEQIRFATEFAVQFFQRKKSTPTAVHLFLEECQELVPQNPMPGEQAMLSAYERLWKLGRNFGIGGSLISQRPQEINKKALNQAGTLFVFQMTGPQERKAIELWVSAQGINEDIAEVLPTLRQGEPHVWSPTFLEVSKKVRIAAKRTADVSITPKVGARAKERPLTPIDAEQLRTQMAATVERAKADDPKELRKQVANLQRELALARKDRPAPAPTIERVEVPIVSEVELKRLADNADSLHSQVLHFSTDASVQTAGLLQAVSALTRSVHPIQPRHETPQRRANLPIVERPGRVVRPATVGGADVRDGLARPAQRILDALGWWEAAGIEQPTRHQAAFVARYSVNGHFNNLLGNMRTGGLVNYPAGGRVSLTTAGRAAAESPAHEPTRDELIDRVAAVLRQEPQRRIFLALVDAGAMLSREDLAARCRYSVNGHFNNLLGSLRSLGVVDYPRGGHVGLSELFEAMS